MTYFFLFLTFNGILAKNKFLGIVLTIRFSFLMKNNIKNAYMNVTNNY